MGRSPTSNADDPAVATFVDEVRRARRRARRADQRHLARRCHCDRGRGRRRDQRADLRATWSREVAGSRRAVPRSRSAATRPRPSTTATASTSRIPWAIAIIVARDVRAAVPHDRLGRDPAEGDPHERAVARRHVRRARLGVPGRPPVGPARLRPTRCARPHHADRRVRVRVRPLDGLRGLHARPHQGGVRRHRRQRPCGRASGCSVRARSSRPPRC